MDQYPAVCVALFRAPSSRMPGKILYLAYPVTYLSPPGVNSDSSVRTALLVSGCQAGLEQESDLSHTVRGTRCRASASTPHPDFREWRVLLLQPSRGREKQSQLVSDTANLAVTPHGDLPRR